AAGHFASRDGGGVIAVANPLSGKFDALRPSLLPGLVESIGHNRRHGARDVRLFEIGARFLESSGETRGVGLAWPGAGAPEHWSGPAREVDFYDVKGVCEQICCALGVPIRFSIAVDECIVAGHSVTQCVV